MFPAEGLYFRQDKVQQAKINCCNHEECWQPTKNNANFCVLHQKMHQDEAIKIYTKIFTKLGKKWKEFIADIKTAAGSDDESQIVFETFIKILDKYGYKISKKEQNDILTSFPGMEGGDGSIRINIARIYDQKYSIILDKMYEKVDVADMEGLDEPMDVNGYLGLTKFYRSQVKEEPITAQDFIKAIHKNFRLHEIMSTISYIDKDHNGYVTASELDDILKLFYPELQNRILLPHIKKFSSIQNRILIDYKGFRDWLKNEVSKLDISESINGKTNSELRQKITMLEKKVTDIKNKEELLGKKIKEVEDVYQSSGQGSRRLQISERAKSCHSR